MATPTTDNVEMVETPIGTSTLIATPEEFPLYDNRAPNGSKIEPLSGLSTPESQKKEFPKNAKTFQFIMLSALYAKLLVVTCIALVSSEVITYRVPLYYYEGFFTYMYGVSILFLLYVYSCMMRAPPRRSSVSRHERLLQSPQQGEAKEGDPEASPTGSATRRKRHLLERGIHHGNIFLRIGAIAFGLGTMIYIGLELGSFFEIPMNSPCYDLMRGVNPILQVVFTFAQMYFIFMNSRLNLHKFKALARFGLMHMMATNICVWIRTLVRESMTDVVTFYKDQGEDWDQDTILLRKLTTEKEAMNATLNTTSCQRVDIMGTIVTDSAPYLYPILIHYSLIGASVVFIIWRNVGRPNRLAVELVMDSPDQESPKSSSKVDCVGSSKGLFFGLFILVAASICLILFFVLVEHPKFERLAIFFADVSECGVMALSLLAMMCGFARVQSLRFKSDGCDALSDLLLRVSVFGVYLYNMFGLIAGAQAALTKEPCLLVLVTCGLTLLQASIQTLFVADVSRRSSYLVEHERSKPGRQVVTFLLICNLTLWIVETFDMERVQKNPVQLDFYGKLPWGVIQKISLPLTIFYRFHSSVMLADVWKNAYRIQPI